MLGARLMCAAERAGLYAMAVTDRNGRCPPTGGGWITIRRWRARMTIPPPPEAEEIRKRVAPAGFVSPAGWN